MIASLNLTHKTNTYLVIIQIVYLQELHIQAQTRARKHTHTHTHTKAKATLGGVFSRHETQFNITNARYNETQLWRQNRAHIRWLQSLQGAEGELVSQQVARVVREEQVCDWSGKSSDEEVRKSERHLKGSIQMTCGTGLTSPEEYQSTLSQGERLRCLVYSPVPYEVGPRLL
jgi:hypothetical protein